MPVRVIKLCLLGDAGVGKTCLVTRFAQNNFPDFPEIAMGAVPRFKTLVVGDTSYKFQIWDIAGNERLADLFASKHCRDAAAAIVVYDVTWQESFQTLNHWIRELKQYGSDNIVLAIVGNKCDVGNKRMVETYEAMEYAEENNAIFLETSAKTAHNVSELFTLIAQKLPPETPTVNNDSTCSESNVTKLLEKSTSATGNCCMCM